MASARIVKGLAQLDGAFNIVSDFVTVDFVDKSRRGENRSETSSDSDFCELLTHRSTFINR
jgi:hypothetical protein